MALALLLKVFLRMRIQHPRLIANGLAVLIVVAVMAWITEYVTLAHALVG